MEGYMQIISGKAVNFGSYKELEFGFDEDGLVLIQGATGSGKSTLCDLAPWVLYGKTAKGGAADEIISWQADSPTAVTVTILLKGNNLHVTRVRGKGKNDLYFNDNVRGKDLADTQRLLNAQLGVDYDTYMAGAYFHEFSKTAQFFTTSAKERRAICEQIVDLSLAKKMQAELVVRKKEAKEQLELNRDKDKSLYSTVTLISLNLERFQKKDSEYLNNISREVKNLERLRDTFEQKQSEVLHSLANKLLVLEEKHKKAKDKEYGLIEFSGVDKEIRRLTEEQKTNGKCKECGGPKNHLKSQVLQDLIKQQQEHKAAYTAVITELSNLKEQIKSTEDQIILESERENNYQQELNNIKNNQSPYDELILEAKKELKEAEQEAKQANAELQIMSQLMTDLEILSDVTDIYRSRVITDTINQVQDNTNKLLASHFDGELTVSFEVVDADKLEVSIHKDGNLCVYTQLSKGQRQLLKLCFGLSIMKAVGNNNAVKFDAIFLDEALDGLDDNLKVKSYSLLQTLALEYGSVYVVEHNEALKSLFPKRFIVTNTNGESTIEKS